MTPVAPRIGNEVSYVTRIKHRSHFSWQAQHLVRFKCHISWQVQYLVTFKCYFFVAGAVLGEVQVLLFVAGAALGECLNVRLGANVVFFNRKCSW